MMDFIEEHEYIYDRKAPYEIICNKYISSEELKYIHTIEHSLEYYYNNSTKYNRQRLKKSFQYVSYFKSLFNDTFFNNYIKQKLNQINLYIYLQVLMNILKLKIIMKKYIF